MALVALPPFKALQDRGQQCPGCGLMQRHAVLLGLDVDVHRAYWHRR